MVILKELYQGIIYLGRNKGFLLINVESFDLLFCDQWEVPYKLEGITGEIKLSTLDVKINLAHLSYSELRE